MTGQGVIKKVQFSNTPGVSFMPTPFDTSNSEWWNWLNIDFRIFFKVHVEMCAEVQQRLQQFSREVLDLLKNQGSHCRLPVSKFVSAYHQYFSRQCRVADYGFSKIIDLLLAIPKSVQVKKKRYIINYCSGFVFTIRSLVMEINVLWQLHIVVKWKDLLMILFVS